LRDGITSNIKLQTSMYHNRRKFLKLTGGLAAGVAVGSLGCKLSPKKDEKEGDNTKAAVNTEKNLDQFGIQLYTLRDDMPKDPKGILQQLASFGYRQIESYEGPLGMFWGMSHTDFKKYMDDLGMAIVSSHCDYTKDLEKKATEAAAIGMKYLIAPWVGPQKTLDDFKKIAEGFNKAGETCKKAGIRFAYHNHDYTFVSIDNQMPQDVLMQSTDASLVDYEMDIYWVVTGGQDPLTWLKKYPNRFKLSHVKDREKNAPPAEKEASCILGTGSIDFKAILKEASAQGMEYYIVEQEKYENSTPIDSAKADAEYLKALKI
jgi:sugar phosphate isomerase/epimerase